MTSFNFKMRLFAAIVTFFAAFTFCNAQTPSVADSLAKLKTLDAAQPDTQYQIALVCLNYAVANPHAPETGDLLIEADQAIQAMKDLPTADASQVATLQGFYYTCRIVQNPALNGALYYMDAMSYFEKALELDPSNALAKHLQERFYEGMAKTMHALFGR